MQFTIQIDGSAYGLTPWLPGTLAPARAGVYQRNDPAGLYSCWDGSRWRDDAADAPTAVKQMRSSPWQDAPWRGLTDAATEHCATCRGHGVVDRGDDADTGEPLISPCPDC